MATRQNSQKYVAAEYENIQSNLIRISEDKVRLILTDYTDKLKKNIDWVGYAGILITLLVTFFTCDYKGFLGVSGDTWRGMFIMLSIVVFYKLIKSLYNKWKRSLSIDDVISKMKNMNHDLQVREGPEEQGIEV